MRSGILITLLLILFAPFVGAQSDPIPEIFNTTGAVPTALFHSETTAPRLGEPVRLNLYVLASINSEIVSVDDPAVPDERIEIIETGEFEILAQNADRLAWRREYLIRLWMVGQWITPELSVTILQDGRQRQIPIQSFTFTVPSELSALSNPVLRPSIPPIDLPYVPAWVTPLLIVIGACILVLSPLALYRVFRRVRAITEGSPAQIVLAELMDLNEQTIDPGILYPIVAAKIRAYLSERLGISAQEATTNEFIQQLSDQSDLSAEARRGLRQILDHADLVKFARYQPDVEEAKKLLRYAIRWIEECERHLESRPVNG